MYHFRIVPDVVIMGMQEVCVSLHAENMQFLYIFLRAKSLQKKKYSKIK